MLTNMNLSQSRDAEEKEKEKIIYFLLKGALKMMTDAINNKVIKVTRLWN